MTGGSLVFSSDPVGRYWVCLSKVKGFDGTDVRTVDVLWSRSRCEEREVRTLPSLRLRSRSTTRERCVWWVTSRPSGRGVRSRSRGQRNQNSYFTDGNGGQWFVVEICESYHGPHPNINLSHPGESPLDVPLTPNEYRVRLLSSDHPPGLLILRYPSSPSSSLSLPSFHGRAVSSPITRSVWILPE